MIFIYLYKIHNIYISILLAYLASTVVSTGKNYPVQIIPPGVLPLERYPVGYFTNITITPSLILAFLMALSLIRDLINGKVKIYKIKSYEIALVIFFFWPIVSDLFGSNYPGFSLLFSIIGLNSLILYIFIKFYALYKKRVLSAFLYLISAVVVFESIISFQQFLSKSPLSKNIEIQRNIEYFGKAADEIEFAFRPSGTFVHANALGIWLSSFLVVLLLLFLKKPNLFSISVFFLGLIAVIITLSRSSWLGLLIGVIVLLFILEKIKKIKLAKKIDKYIKPLFFPGIILVIFFILPRAEKSVFTFSEGGGYFRKIQILKGLEIIRKNPLFGVGSTRSVQEGLQLVSTNDPNFSIVLDIHNWYFLKTVEHGIPSILLFIILIILYFRELLRKKFSNLIMIGLFGGIVSSLISGLFQPFMNMQIIILSLAFL